MNEDGEMVGTFTVPADIVTGEATVWAGCMVSETETVNEDVATLTLVAAATTPEATTPEAEAAAPVVAQPTFTG